MNELDIERDFILDPSCILYLPLWKKDGAQFMSDDMYGHLCTVTGALWTPQGRYFDGVDDKIALASFGFFREGKQTILMTFKLITTIPGTREFLLYYPGAASGNRVYFIHTNGTGHILFQGGDLTTYILAPNASLKTTEFMTLAVVRDFTNKKLNAWLDKTKTLDNQAITINAASSNALTIGNDEVDETFNGWIKEIIVFNRELSYPSIMNYVDMIKGRVY